MRLKFESSRLPFNFLHAVVLLKDYKLELNAKRFMLEKRKIKKYLKKCLTIKEMAVIIIAVCRTVRYKFHNRTPKLASNY